MNFLNTQVSDSRNTDLTKAASCVTKFTSSPKILQLRFGTWDKHHRGTIRSWVIEKDGPQLRDYISRARMCNNWQRSKVLNCGHTLISLLDHDGNRKPPFGNGIISNPQTSASIVLLPTENNCTLRLQSRPTSCADTPEPEIEVTTSTWVVVRPVSIDWNCVCTVYHRPEHGGGTTPNSSRSASYVRCNSLV
jgi:hypothetical protein